MGELTCLKRGPGATPHHVQQTAGRTWWQSSLLGEGEIDIRWAHQLPGKPVEGHTPHHPLWQAVISWGLGQVCRKVSHVHKMWVKQALVGQGMYREQENSHLEWPDHTHGFLEELARREGGKLAGKASGMGIKAGKPLVQAINT